MHHRHMPASPILPAALGILCLAAGALCPARADEAAPPPVVGRWVPTLETGLNLTQGSFSHNWSGGDQGSIVWTLNTNASLTNQLSSKLNWSNTLKAAYGQTHQQVLDPHKQRVWDSPQKSTDLLDFVTLFRFTLGGFVDPFVSGHFESQFQDASDVYGRRLSLNPMNFTETAGVARQLIKTEDRDVLTRIGFSATENSRKTFGPDSTSDAVTRQMTSDVGLEWVTDAKAKILQGKVAWTSKLVVNQPVHYSGKSDLKGALARTDANTLQIYGLTPDAANYTTTARADWENIFTSQITKLISVNLYARWVYMKYDNSVKPKVDPTTGGLADPAGVAAAIRKAGQFKETLSLGVTYRFL